MPERQFRRRRLFAGSGLAILALAAALIVPGELLTRPARQAVGAPPPELAAEAIALPTPDGGRIAGWFAASAGDRAAVLLLHGVRGDRRSMVGRALTLRRAGYAVLLVDLPAHGESTGERITFGWRERDGVRAALAELRRRLPDAPIGVVAVSLGAASFTLAEIAPAPQAAVLEAMYPTIDDAVADRLAMRLGAAGRAIAPLLLAQMPWRLGVTAEQLRPIAALPHIGAPVLIVAGTEDRHTTFAESRRLFEVAAEPKRFHAVVGAAHVDFHAFDGAGWEAAVLPFLARHLDGHPPCRASGDFTGASPCRNNGAPSANASTSTSSPG